MFTIRSVVNEETNEESAACETPPAISATNNDASKAGKTCKAGSKTGKAGSKTGKAGTKTGKAGTKTGKAGTKTGTATCTSLPTSAATPASAATPTSATTPELINVTISSLNSQTEAPDISIYDFPDVSKE